MKKGKNAEILNLVHQQQLESLKTYAFQRITDPAVTAITPDSLRRALNQHEVAGVDEDEGAPDWLYHRAGDGATDTGACRRADICTGNRTSALTTGVGECTAADCSRSSRGNPRA